MIMRSRTLRSLPALALLALALSGCSESDIPELQERRLADARAEGGGDTAPASGGAEPAEPGDESGGEPDGEPDGQPDGEPGSESGAESVDEDVIQPGDTAGSVDLDDYDLVFSDEFRGLTLDATLWNTALPWGPDVVVNDELQYYVDALGSPEFGYDPFLLDGETLTIEAMETPEGLRAAANDQPWLSGVLSTEETFDFTYGYAEARIDVPEGQGLWSTFLMLGSTFTELSPRTFVAEHDGGRPDSVFHNYEYVDMDGNLRARQYEVDAVDDFGAGFHTVGVSWEPGELLYFVDGVARYRIVGDDVSDEAMYLVLGFAIGGTWPGAPDAATPRPADLRLDYVRVWQRREAS